MVFMKVVKIDADHTCFKSLCDYGLLDIYKGCKGRPPLLRNKKMNSRWGHSRGCGKGLGGEDGVKGNCDQAKNLITNFLKNINIWVCSRINWIYTFILLYNIHI